MLRLKAWRCGCDLTAILEDVKAALGSMDVSDMRPAIRYDGNLSVQLRRYEYPCDHGPGFGDTDGCLLPVSDPQLLG